MTERDETNNPTGWDGTPAPKITPVDVQQKEFRVARFGAGYRMREVDEFLDRVTDALTALIAENERLQRTAGTRPTAPAVPSPAAGGDREAVDAFLRSEKGFLQDLGTLVQSHAEQLKAMARSARKEPAAAPAQTAQIGSEVPEPDGDPVAQSTTAESTTAEEVDRLPADVEAMSAPETQQPEPAMMAEPVDEPPDAPAHDDAEVEVGAERDETVTGAVAEEPIQIEEPEPARSGRADDDRDGLRELFWGEE
jgi:DivIVA domain-containing protein